MNKVKKAAKQRLNGYYLIQMDQSQIKYLNFNGIDKLKQSKE
jgi:hypothetical protein